MSTYSFRTNNIPRPLLEASQLTPAERATVDYLEDDATVFRYRGDIIALDDIMVAPDDLKAEGYDGYAAWSIGNGIAVRFFDREGNPVGDGGEIVVAAYTNN